MSSADPYRSIAGLYDTVFEPVNRGLRALGLKLFTPTKGMSILDVGCGTGLHLELYRKYNCNLHGIDPSPSMLALARKRLGDSAQLHLGDARNMPYENESFDLAISMLALHEMRPDMRHAVISEIKRVLRSEGRILFVDFHPGPIRPIKGRFTKLFITISEISAGREHFKNYREFIKAKGLPSLIIENGLTIEQQRIVSGGTLALFLAGKDKSKT